MKIKDDVIRLTEQCERMGKVLSDYTEKKVAMAEEIKDLREQVAQLDKNRSDRLKAYLVGGVDSYDSSAEFPDLNSLKNEIEQRENDLNQAVAFIDENVKKLYRDRQAVQEERELIISKAWVKLIEAEMPQFKEAFFRVFRHYIGATKIHGATMHVPSIPAFISYYFWGEVLDGKHPDLEPLKKSAGEIFFKEYGVKP